MSGGDGFAVAAQALTGHARTVDAVAAAVQTAHDAAKQVTMGVEAYGRIPTCRMMPVLLEPLQGRAVTSLLAAVSALHSGAEGLRTNARAYHETEAAVAASFDRNHR